MPMKEFVALVKERTGVSYHANTISLLEQNKQGWRLSDVRALAAVDPLKRGEVWLSALHGPATERADVDAPAAAKHRPARDIDPAIVKPAPRSTRKKDAG